MKFLVDYSIEKDTIPYLKAIWKMQFKSFGRANLKERLLEKFPEKFKVEIMAAKTEDEAKKVILDFLKRRLAENKPAFEKKIKEIQTFLDLNKEKIIGDLESLFGKKFPFRKIGVYLTTAGICPYNYNELWFMAYENADEKRVVSVALHELNHFMYYYYYLENLKTRGFSQHRLMVLKEALPVLTGDDDNKPETIELKKFLQTIKSKPMDEIIELAVHADAFKKIGPS